MNGPPFHFMMENLLFKQTFKNIDDKLWKDEGCSSELDYEEYSFHLRRRPSRMSVPERLIEESL